jgi:integrase/recombinase XerD
MAYEYKREPLTLEEADRLWNACENLHEKMIVVCLLDTGLRVSELCSLTPSNIQWQQKSLIISGKGGPYGTRSKKRIVPMSQRVRSLLEHYFMINDKWFAGPRRVQQILKELANRAQISRPVSPHVLRHTFASLGIQKGISLPAIQKILGHDHLSTTQIYLNLTPQHVLEEYERKW